MSTLTNKSELFSASAVSPFGLPLDPYEIKGKILSTKYNVISGTSYLLSNNLFTIESSTLGGEEALVSLWTKLNRKNFQDEVPTLHELECS